MQIYKQKHKMCRQEVQLCELNDDRIRLVLVNRWAGVVLVAPDPVPNTGDERRGNEDSWGVVDVLGGNRDVRGHAEERKCEQRPSWQDSLAGFQFIHGGSLTDGDDVADSTEGTEIELASLDLLTAGSQTNSNGSRV